MSIFEKSFYWIVKFGIKPKRVLFLGELDALV